MAGTCPWAPCTPSLKHLGQAGVDVPFGIDGLPLQKWYGGYMTRFCKENSNHLLRDTFRSFEFYRGGVGVPLETAIQRTAALFQDRTDTHMFHHQ